MPREPGPIRFKSGTMPANDCLWLDENQRLLPSRPEPPQHHLEQSVRSGQSRLRTSLPQDRKLLPKRQVFQEQVSARTEELGCQYGQKFKHKASFTWRPAKPETQLICLIQRKIAISASYRMHPIMSPQFTM